jgi:Tol biopolymer transport system component/DNA-binding winged helix-turn-helix (wHTH) protein
MADLSISRARLVRFGPFELDVRAGELRKHGIRIKLREQPVQILLLLLEHPGDVVLREEIRLRLWPNNTIVEFDHGINAAIQKLRDALGESAGQPHYVETVARRGYRFLGEVERVGQSNPAVAAGPEPGPPVIDIETDDLTNQTISHYRIFNKVGSGGMGVVYRAEDLNLGRRVALKFLPSRVGDLPESMVRRFEREARAASALNHPNICTIYGFEKFAGQPVIVMEFVDGETLAARLAKGPLPLAQAISLAVQIAGALAEAHGKGIVHRDLKPANIMLTRSGVKVLDFGLAKFNSTAAPKDVAASMTQAGPIVGTAPYMSPEQAQGKETDVPTDIFSFGLVLYEMLTGRRAFEGDSPAAVIAAILEHETPSVANAAPAALDLVLSRCLAKEVDDRWQSARDVGFALGAIVPPAVSLPPARCRWPWVAVSAALALMIGAAGWLVRGNSRPKENPLANARFVRLTDFDGDESEVSISRDGKFVAFFAERDGETDVLVNQIGTGNFNPLAHVALVETYIRKLGFSPAGSDIWLSGAKNAARLRLIPLMGGSPRGFLSDRAVSVDWSPEGKPVVYHTFDPGDPIFVADRTGANAKQILINSSPGGHLHFPTFSADGRWIYFVKGFPDTTDWDIWRIPASGGEAQRLTHHNAEVGYPTPTDSRTVFYIASAEDGSGPRLWSLDTESKTSRRVSFGLERYTSLAASGDGHRLVASVANPTANLWSVPILDRLVEERDVQPFAVPTVRALMPRFGAASLFYLSSRGAADGLWRFRDGRAEEIWKSAEGAILEPTAVSPDGRWATLALRRAGKKQLNLIATDGSEMRPLAETIDVRGTAAWSPDSQWIIIGGSDAAGPGLFRVPAAGGAIQRLLTRPAVNPVMSPDGSLIVYSGPAVSRTVPMLAIRPDGEPVDLPEIRLLVNGERYRFLPDGKGLIYMQGALGRQDFWRLDLGTKKVRQLSHFKNPATMRSFDITPDGRGIVFDRLRQNSDVVLIDLPR